jgi:hypothetical protein
MQTKLLVMRPEAPNETHVFELSRQPSYAELAAILRPLLACEDFEHVTVLADMFVDEMGHPKGLPRNENATAIYRRNALLHQGISDAETIPWIAGPAALFERIVWR